MRWCIAVAIPDQVLRSGGAGVLEIHDEVSGQLSGPGRGGVRGRAEDAYAAGGVLNDGEDEQAGSGQGAGFEEVGREDCVCLAAEEGGPGLVLAMRRWFDVVGSEDFPDG